MYDQYDYHTIARLMYDQCQTSAWLIYDQYHTSARQMYDQCQTSARLMYE